MKILKFFQYAYIIFAVMFIYEAISNWSEIERSLYVFVFAALAMFMFFFRKRFKKKFEDSNKHNI